MESKVLKHASIKIDNIYFDPYQIDVESHDAKYILITHDHYDHFSINDIKKLINPQTVVIAPEKIVKQVVNEMDCKFLIVNQCSYYILEEMFNKITIETFASYNIESEFHKKQDGNVGYILTYNKKVFVVLGDTDDVPEIQNLKCDVLFVPIGGKYTMNSLEAAKYTNKIKPKLVVPIHYNLIVGNKKDEKMFLTGLNSKIKYEIQIH